MRKIFDKKSGAVVIKHDADELKQMAESRELKRNSELIKKICKMLNISEEQLENIPLEGDEA